jgi:peptidoglycan/xylan/chitin deacetylase (PgdA/CDA1 family)
MRALSSRILLTAGAGLLAISLAAGCSGSSSGGQGGGQAAGGPSAVDVSISPEPSATTDSPTSPTTAPAETSAAADPTATAGPAPVSSPPVAGTPAPAPTGGPGSAEGPAMGGRERLHPTPVERALIGRHRGSGPAGSLQSTGSSGVAMTFDDGPDPNLTPQLLTLLAQQHVKATFCLVGTQVRAHPALVRRIVAEGHTLCNHTWHHDLYLGKRKPDEIRADMLATNNAIRKAAPGAKIAYFRAPGGNFTEPVATIAAELGMQSIYWHVEPRDWDHTADASDGAHLSRIIAAVQGHTHKGSIILSHDYDEPLTITAYRSLIPWLKGRFHLIALPVEPPA